MAQKARKQAGPPISAEQIKKLHTLKSALKINEETYRATLDNAAGVASSKALTMTQAADLIDDWQRKAVAAGVWQTRKPRAKKFDDLENRIGVVAMATPPQMRMIEAVWNEVSRANEPEARSTALRHFLKRIAKVDSLRFLDRDGARAVIIALKEMQRSATKGSAAANG